MNSVHIPAGMHIDDAVHVMVEQAVLAGSEAVSEFNGITLVVSPDAKPDAVLAEYHRLADERSESYRTSPRGRKAAADRADAIVQAQATHDRQLAALATLDFANQTAVLVWLSAIQSATDTVGVHVARERILSAFADKGMMPNVNVDEQFNADDPDNVFGYLVGQALDGLTCGGIHPVFHRFAEEWRAKFGRSA